MEEIDYKKICEKNLAVKIERLAFIDEIALEHARKVNKTEGQERKDDGESSRNNIEFQNSETKYSEAVYEEGHISGGIQRSMKTRKSKFYYQCTETDSPCHSKSEEILIKCTKNHVPEYDDFSCFSKYNDFDHVQKYDNFLRGNDFSNGWIGDTSVRGFHFAAIDTPIYLDITDPKRTVRTVPIILINKADSKTVADKVFAHTDIPAQNKRFELYEERSLSDCNAADLTVGS